MNAFERKHELNIKILQRTVKLNDIISQMALVMLLETTTKTKTNIVLKTIYYGKDLKYQMVSNYNMLV